MLTRAAHAARTLTVRHTGDCSRTGPYAGGCRVHDRDCRGRGPWPRGRQRTTQAPGPQRLRQLHRRDRDQHHRDRDDAHPAPPPGLAAFGIYGLAGSVVAYLQLFDMGFGAATIRQVAADANRRPKGVTATLNTNFFALSILGFVALLVGLRRRGRVPAAVQRPRRARQTTRSSPSRSSRWPWPSRSRSTPSAGSWRPTSASTGCRSATSA